MTNREVVELVEPLVRHGAFSSPEQAVRELVHEYVLRQIDRYRSRITAYEERYGMPFEHFSAYLRERSTLLVSKVLDSAERETVARAVMAEEEDWLDWKIARDFLTGWLGLNYSPANQ